MSESNDISTLLSWKRIRDRSDEAQDRIKELAAFIGGAAGGSTRPRINLPLDAVKFPNRAAKKVDHEVPLYVGLTEAHGISVPSVKNAPFDSQFSQLSKSLFYLKRSAAIHQGGNVFEVETASEVTGMNAEKFRALGPLAARISRKLNVPDHEAVSDTLSEGSWRAYLSSDVKILAEVPLGLTDGSVVAGEFRIRLPNLSWDIWQREFSFYVRQDIGETLEELGGRRGQYPRGRFVQGIQPANHRQVPMLEMAMGGRERSFWSPYDMNANGDGTYDMWHRNYRAIYRSALPRIVQLVVWTSFQVDFQVNAGGEIGQVDFGASSTDIRHL